MRNQVKYVLKVHTSPDKHPNTFFLDKHRFNDQLKLANIRQHVTNQTEIQPSNPLVCKR